MNAWRDFFFRPTTGWCCGRSSGSTRTPTSTSPPPPLKLPVRQREREEEDEREGRARGRERQRETEREAVAPVGLLAGLLGSDFSALARRTAPALLEKGADKKAVVAEAVRGCLAALSTGSCLTLAEAAELALAAMSRSTNTQLRSTAARWLAAAVSAADAEGVGRALDAFDAPLQLLEEDATAEVRSPPPPCIWV